MDAALALKGSAPRVVIVGGGFAGLEAAKALKRTAVHVTLVDRQNHHCFQPLLYQVATAALSPADIAWPIRMTAWLFWSVAHIYYLIGGRNRFIVALDWLWDYATFERGARLIHESGSICQRSLTGAIGKCRQIYGFGPSISFHARGG